MSMNKISMLQIPTKIVRNSKISSIDFVIICYLKYFCFLKNSKEFSLSIKEAKEFTGIKDNRTFKKSFETLVDLNILKSLPEFGRKDIKSLKINLKVLNSKDDFVQLPTSLIKNHLKTMSTYEFRFLFFLESFIIRKSGQKNYANPSISSICEKLLVSPNTALKTLNSLEMKKFIEIDRHEIHSNQNEDGIYKFHRLCNNYRINFEKINSKVG